MLLSAARSAVDVWVSQNQVDYASNISIWLSPGPWPYSDSYGIACATNWKPSKFSPSKDTANCTQTLSNTQYVTVHKLFDVPSGSYYLQLWEIAVVRAGACCFR